MAKEAQNNHSTAKSRLACMLLLPPPNRSIEDTIPFSRPGHRRDEIQPDCFSLAKEHGRIRACAPLTPFRGGKVKSGSVRRLVRR
ncbi:hypothetical protein GGE07_000504 [Sinorhizobium terangae]|nr:hypothetical protein [Sinorhizobium terangae]